ncbi:MAG: ATP synthase F1 subunit epsilon [Verrucomicrobia bacterium]|nr:ATP synthase F1 subunit epsilon [Verrucomicrobiota bacterium]
MPTLRLDVVTPERRAYAEDVDMVVIPGEEGELGVLAGHAPTVAAILPGVLRVTKGGRTFELLVGNGFAEITQTGVSVLADMALEDADAIDEQETEQAIERAQAALKQWHADAESRADEEALLRRAVAQLQFKRRRRGQHPDTATALGGGQHPSSAPPRS